MLVRYIVAIGANGLLALFGLSVTIMNLSKGQPEVVVFFFALGLLGIFNIRTAQKFKNAMTEEAWLAAEVRKMKLRYKLHEMGHPLYADPPEPGYRDAPDAGDASDGRRQPPPPPADATPRRRD